MRSIAFAFLAACMVLASGCSTSRTSTGHSSNLVIDKATYGVGATNTADVTEEVRLLAKSGYIRLHPRWALGIDPAYGKIKRITIAYRYKGEFEVASFDQDEDLLVPLNQ